MKNVTALALALALVTLAGCAADSTDPVENTAQSQSATDGTGGFETYARGEQREVAVDRSVLEQRVHIRDYAEPTVEQRMQELEPQKPR